MGSLDLRRPALSGLTSRLGILTGLTDITVTMLKRSGITPDFRENVFIHYLYVVCCNHVNRTRMKGMVDGDGENNWECQQAKTK